MRRAQRVLVSKEIKEYTPPYTPHKAQYEFHMNPSRFRVVSAGRRWGKTMCGVRELWKILQEAKEEHPVGWVVAPSFPLSIVDWDTAQEMMGPFILQQNAQDHWMEVSIAHKERGMTRTAKLEFKTAERDDRGLRGRGLSGLVVDEASMVSKKAWELGLRPALADKLGKAIFISTPRGTGGLFYELYQLGQGLDPQWKSWKFPSSSNPYFPKEEWAYLESITPQGTWMQEYLAEFVEGEGSVFHDLHNVSEMPPKPYDPNTRWVIGADLAKTVDFTVLYPINDYGEPGEIVRIKDISWNVQQEAIQRLSERYGNARVIVDSSGIGDPVEDNLRRIGVPVRGMKTGSTTTKEELIEGLSIALQHNWVKLPSKGTHKWIWDELESYQKDVTEHGNTRYHAPEGRHDDGVIALSLAVAGVGARLGRAKRTTPEPEDPDRHFTTWGQYWSQVNPRRKKRTPFTPSFGRNASPNFRFKVLG
jgi:hypothetical protein